MHTSVDARGATQVLTAPTLILDHLHSLIAGDAMAIMVPGYYTADECEALVGKTRCMRWGTYEEVSAQGIGTVGDSLFNCITRPLEDHGTCDYFERAVAQQRMLREGFRPYISPMDRLRLDLDAIWPHGCVGLRIEGRQTFYGLLRRFSEGGGALPHTDHAGWDYPSDATQRILDQIFANVYLSKTSVGGAIQLWRRRVATQWDYDTMRDGDTYGLRRELLGEPDVEIDPPVGALVIASARYVHAVTPATGTGERVSSSSFINFYGEDEHLAIHS